MHWWNVRLSKDVSGTLQIITCSKHISTTILALPLFLHPCPHPTPMVPNKFFDNMKQTIEASTQFIPCPACNRQLKSKGGFTKHMGLAHVNYQGHFSSQFIYLMNKIDGDEDYNYGLWLCWWQWFFYQQWQQCPISITCSILCFPLLPVWPASPDAVPTKYQWQTGNPSLAYHNAPSVLLVWPPSPDAAYIKHSWLMDVNQEFWLWEWRCIKLERHSILHFLWSESFTGQLPQYQTPDSPEGTLYQEIPLKIERWVLTLP